MNIQILLMSLAAASRDAFHRVPNLRSENLAAPQGLRRVARGGFIALCATLLSAFARTAYAADGYNTSIDDRQDLYAGNVAGLGLPTWRVSEPFVNLWIQDAVIRYRTSAGKTVNLDIAYRQRGATDTSGSFGFGPGWQCSWFTRVVYSTAYLDGGVYAFGSVDDFVPPMGGSLAYVADGVTPEYNTYSTMSHGAAGKCGSAINVTYADGTLFQYPHNAGCTNPVGKDGEWTNYLSAMQDPQGRTVTLTYVTNY